jgi:hypothetical protein
VAAVPAAIRNNRGKSIVSAPAAVCGRILIFHNGPDHRSRLQRLITDYLSLITREPGSYGRGATVGRGRGVGACRGVGVGLAVAVGVGVALAIAVAVAVGVAVGVDVGVVVAVDAGVAVGVDVNACAKVGPPLFCTS